VVPVSNGVLSVSLSRMGLGLKGSLALQASQYSGPVLDSFTRFLLTFPSRRRYPRPVIITAFLDCFSSLCEPTHWAHELFV